MLTPRFRLIIFIAVFSCGFVFPLAGQVSTFPWTEDFEQFGLCVTDCKIPCPLNNGWTNATDDDFDWIVNLGPTPSANTGPTQGVSPVSGRYLYLESNTACTGAKEAYLLSPEFDFSSVNYPVLEFHYHAFGFGEGRIHLDVFVNGAWTENIIEPIQGSEPDWQSRSVPMPFAAGLNNVRLRWRGVSGPVETSDFAIDGVHIREAFSDDLAPVGLAPSNRLCGSGNDSLSFLIQNLGFQAQQSIETQVMWGAGPWQGATRHRLAIHPGEEVVVKLAAPNLPPGQHTIRLISRAGNGADQQASNDTLYTTIIIRPVIGTLPYLATYEVGKMDWYSEGTRNSWEHGVPRGNALSGTPDGNNCWGTNLSGDYEPFSYAFLYSPCFNLVSVTEEVIVSFDYKTNLEFRQDMMWLEYSLDGGAWQKLGSFGGGIKSWYDTNQDVWTGSPHFWKEAAHSLIGLEGHVLQFRFVHYSDGSRQFEGALIDRFMLRYAYDLAVSDVLPNDVCDAGLGATEIVSVNLENKGFYEINQAGLSFQVDNGGFTPTEQFSGILESGESQRFVFAKTADLAASGAHIIEVEAVFPQDMVSDNNSVRERAGNYAPLLIDLGADTAICPGDRLVLKTGVPGGQYFWSTGNITQDLYVFSGGEYSVLVFDSVGCESRDTIAVDMPSAVQLDIQPLLPISCFGDSGILQVFTTDGVGPFQYLWSTGDNSHVTRAVPSGSYSLMVTDGEGCQYQEQVNFTQPDPLQIAIDTILAVSCTRDSNGQISVFANGGTAPYQYRWANGNTGPTLSNLKSGLYQLITTDDNGCETQIEPIFVPVSADTAPRADFDYSVSGGIVQFYSNSENTSSLTWFFGDGGRAIGQSAPNYEYERNGLYPVTLVARNACGEDTAIRFVNVLHASAPEPEVLEGLSLFPVPVNGPEFFIENEGEMLKDLGIRIYDPQGKLLKFWDFQAAPSGWKKGFDTFGLANGLYLVEVLAESKRKVWKVTVAN